VCVMLYYIPTSASMDNALKCVWIWTVAYLSS